MDARLGLCVSLAALLLLAWAPAALAADPNFKIDPFPPTAGDPTSFTAEDSGLDPGWDFDEDPDFEVEGTAVGHVFASSGPAQVRMKASDGTVVTKDFTVNAPPVAAFRFSPIAPTTGQGVVFTSESTDSDGPDLEHRWDFGDGSFASGASLEHAFTSPGTKTVQLTVTDAKKAKRSVTQQVEVSAPPVPLGPALLPGPPDTEPSFITPFPVVRLVGQVFVRATVVRLLSVQAPRGALVRVRCRGRDCPAASVRRLVKQSGRVRFRAFERSLRAGTRLALFVRRSGEIGKYTRFAMRAGQRPLRTDGCLLPGERKPVRCPS